MSAGAVGISLQYCKGGPYNRNWHNIANKLYLNFNFFFKFLRGQARSYKKRLSKHQKEVSHQHMGEEHPNRART